MRAAIPGVGHNRQPIPRAGNGSPAPRFSGPRPASGRLGVLVKQPGSGTIRLRPEAARRSPIRRSRDYEQGTCEICSYAGVDLCVAAARLCWERMMARPSDRLHISRELEALADRAAIMGQEDRAKELRSIVALLRVREERAIASLRLPRPRSG